MPGSTNTGKEVLYTKEDLTQAAFNAKVRTYRTYRSDSGGTSGFPPQCYFRPNTIPTLSIRPSPKGANSKGKGKPAFYAPTGGFRPAYGRGFPRKGGKGRGRGMAPQGPPDSNAPPFPQERRARSECRREKAMAARAAPGTHSAPPAVRRQTALSPQIEADMVGKPWLKSHPAAGQGGPEGRSATTPDPIVPNTTQKQRRSRSCRSPPPGVSGNWSCTGGKPRSTSSPAPLVYNFQSGRSARLHQSSEKASHRRCSRVEPVFLSFIPSKWTTVGSSFHTSAPTGGGQSWISNMLIFTFQYTQSCSHFFAFKWERRSFNSRAPPLAFLPFPFGGQN